MKKPPGYLTRGLSRGSYADLFSSHERLNRADWIRDGGGKGTGDGGSGSRNGSGFPEVVPVILAQEVGIPNLRRQALDIPFNGVIGAESSRRDGSASALL